MLNASWRGGGDDNGPMLKTTLHDGRLALAAWIAMHFLQGTGIKAGPCDVVRGR
jgi:hypothetical protein